MAAGETGGGSETSCDEHCEFVEFSSASSPADLRQRIDALKAELADLNTELAAETDADSGSSAAHAPQDQGSPAPATAGGGASCGRPDASAQSVDDGTARNGDTS